MEVLFVLFGVFFVAPIAVSSHLGDSRDRTGWMWGLFLGWLGVLILACMRPVPYDQRMSKPTYTAETMFPPPPKAHWLSGKYLTKDDS